MHIRKRYDVLVNGNKEGFIRYGLSYHSTISLPMLRAYFQSIYSSCDVFTFGTILMAGSYLYTFNCDSNKHIVGYTQILETIMKLMLQNKYEVLSTVSIMVLMIFHSRLGIYVVKYIL